MNKRKKTGVKIYKSIYDVNAKKGTTTCTLTCEFNINTIPDSIRNGILGALKREKYKMFNQESCVFDVVATVKCHKGDNFDEQKGKRLAESKAKKMLFNRAERYWYNVYKVIHKSAKEIDSLIEANINAKKGEIAHYKILKG